MQEDQIQRLKALRDKQKLSIVYETPDLSVTGEVISEAEKEFFKVNGFIVKHGLLDQEKLAIAFDRIWTHLLANVGANSDWQLSRDDKGTWLNPQWAPMAEAPTAGYFQGRQPMEQFGRILKMHDIGHADYLLDLLPNEPRVRQVAEAILSKDLRPSHQTRGIYGIFPTNNPADPSGSRRLRGTSLGPHVDQVCQQLNTCAYLDDVPERCGGFTVYPGSHKIMFHAHEFEANYSPSLSFVDAMEEVIETIEPLELIGKKGSVIFWHGRTVHSSGIHTGNSIRWALIDDFTENLEVLSEEEHKEAGQYEWFKNARLFRQDRPVTDDMWRNWNIST